MFQLPFELRPYQVEAVDALFKHNYGTVVAPTGSGKTAVAIECMRRLDARTAIIVPTINLMHQWQRKLRDCGVHATVFYGEEKSLSSTTIFVYNSALNHFEKLDGFDFLVFDEVHHLGAEQFSILLEAIPGKSNALGITSHVRRMDGAHFRILQLLPVIYKMKISEARENGFISSLEVVEMPSAMNLKEEHDYQEYSNTILWAFRKLHTIEITYIAKLASRGNILASACLSAIAKRKMLLSNVASKPARVAEVISKHPDEKILVFSESISSIENIKRGLMRQGIPVGVYHSKISIQKRKLVLNYWGKAFNILLSVRCLEEGTDVPTVRIGVIIASGSTKRQFIQRIGRLMRIRKDGSQGVLYIVYCPGTVEARYAGKIRRILRQ